MRCLSPSSVDQWYIQNRLRYIVNLSIVKIQMSLSLSSKYDIVLPLLKRHKWLVLLIIPQKSKFHGIGRGGCPWLSPGFADLCVDENNTTQVILILGLNLSSLYACV